jgi:hypothetical protein
VPIGHKTSRAPRQRMLRTIRLMLGTESGEVRLRNLSETGAMIDGVDLPDEAIGHPVRVELADGQWSPAVITWIGDGRAGLRFDHMIDLERLGRAPVAATAADAHAIAAHAVTAHGITATPVPAAAASGGGRR